jgi:chemotaxis protein methyltransferase CheR
VRDADCVAFLQDALPRLGLVWTGFRRVRGQVCKRLGRRLRALGLAGLDDYRRYLDAHPDEWSVLGELCRVSISRFYRDRRVFDVLRDEGLPRLAEAAARRGGRSLHAWSAGCAGGEEPYTLALIWNQALAPRFASLALHVIATDADPRALERARRACYSSSSLKELPAGWRESGFRQAGALHCVSDDVRALVELHQQDLREARPDGPFDLVLCRNLAFTYFDRSTRAEVASALASRLVPGGLLVVGAHERLEEPAAVGLRPWPPCPSIYEKT